MSLGTKEPLGRYFSTTGCLPSLMMIDPSVVSIGLEYLSVMANSANDAMQSTVAIRFAIL
jgi:hypothetical protein